MSQIYKRKLMLNTYTLARDIKRGDFELYEDQEGHINLRNYLLENQEGTKIHEYLTKNTSISITYNPAVNSKRRAQLHNGDIKPWHPMDAITLNSDGKDTPVWLHKALSDIVIITKNVGDLHV